MESYDYYLRSIAHGMRYYCDQNLDLYGITNQQARLLGDIYDILESGRELSRKTLSEAMGLRGPSVTSLLNGLEKNGFIVRQQGDEDGRTMQIEITTKAKLLIEEYENVFAQAEEKLLQNFSDEEKKSFMKLLKKAYENMALPNHR
jgi:MarR family transcriptional regulator, repressor for mepA